MRERILKYLRDKGVGVTAEEILQESLNIRAPNPAAALKVLSAIVGHDSRIARKGRLWELNPEKCAKDPEVSRRIAVLHIQRSSSAPIGKNLRGALFSPSSNSTWEFDLTPGGPPMDIPHLGRWLAREEFGLLVAWSEQEVRLWNSLLLRWGLGPAPTNRMAIRVMAERVLDSFSRRSRPEDLAVRLELPAPDTDKPSSMARFLNSCFQTLSERTPSECRQSFESLHAWIGEGRRPVDFSRYMFGRDFLRRLPERPGVYLMRNRAGTIIYVGKSRNLHRRVNSYFTATARADSKVARIQDQIYCLEVTPTANEVEALLLEMRLIRTFRPTINLQAEVHEQNERYGKALNLVLLVREEDGVRAYLVRKGLFAGQHRLALGRDVPARVKNRIRNLFYSERSRSRTLHEHWEIEIVNRWIGANRNRLNFLDIDEAGCVENAIRCLNAYLHDPAGLSRKVIYR